MIALFGGAFDPPHLGHVALVRDARAHFGFDRLLVLVVADPGHKRVDTDAGVRLGLARLAFPGAEVELDRHARTVDLLRARRFDEPLFLIGADEFADFLAWKEPDAVLDLCRLGVATRPGYPCEPLDAVLAELRRPDRVAFFAVEPHAVSSREIRARAAAGEPLAGLVPDAVGAEVVRLGLYGAGGKAGRL